MTTTQTILYREKSRPYYFSEFDRNFEATYRMAKYKEIAMRKFWGDRFVDSEIVENDEYLQVVIHYK